MLLIIQFICGVTFCVTLLVPQVFRLHIFLNRVILEQIIGEDHERLEREYI